MTIVRMIDFPTTKVRACITENEDGDTIIFVNAKLAHDERIRGYLHEMRHKNNNDFRKENIQEVERDAHREAPLR